jgi:hypothetical protein
VSGLAYGPGGADRDGYQHGGRADRGRPGTRIDRGHAGRENRLRHQFLFAFGDADRDRDQTPGPPIQVGDGPYAIAITP